MEEVVAEAAVDDVVGPGGVEERILAGQVRVDVERRQVDGLVQQPRDEERRQVVVAGRVDGDLGLGGQAVINVTPGASAPTGALASLIRG